MKVIPIEQLLKFFMKEQKIGYQGINFIISVFEDDFFSHERKMSELENVLGEFGLTKRTKRHRDNSTKNLHEMSDIFKDGFWDSPIYEFEYNTGLYSVKILNGVIWFERCLN